MGAGCLLRKYLALLYGHVTDILPVAASLAAYSNKHFSVVARLVKADVSGKL